MSATIHALPVRLGPKPKAKRASKNNPIVRATVHTLPNIQDRSSAVTAYEIYCQAGNVDDSDPMAGLRLYTKALELDPTLAIARVNMGNCYYRMHQVSEAKACYFAAIADSPTCPEALYNAGYLLLSEHHCEQAERLLFKAVEYDPKFADAHFNLAMCYQEMRGRNADAVKHYARYLELTADGTGESQAHWREVAKRQMKAL
jgi:tetratricopeptide (TPR) repeat protein